MGKHRVPAASSPSPERTGWLRRVLVLFGVTGTVAVAVAVLVIGLLWGLTGPGGGTGTAAADPLVDSSASAAPMLTEIPAPSGSPGISPHVTASASASRSPAPSTSASRPGAGASPTRTPPPVPAPTTAGPAPLLAATYSTRSDWTGDYQVNFTVRNTGSATANGWAVTVTFSGSGSVSSGDAVPSGAGDGAVMFSPKSDNRVIAPGGSITFGFKVSGTHGRAPAMTGCTVNGGTCSG